ncbi:MAG: radical SAM protein [Methanomassiliicoccales archaeon]
MTALGTGHRYFTTANDLIEIDITYECNLRCFNCDRSCTQAPTKEQMELGQVEKFIRESISSGRNWKRIRVMGGEPFLHPKVIEILERLDEYRRELSPSTLIEIVTNGFGDDVVSKYPDVPEGIIIHNTNKKDRFQKKFEPFNLAPADDESFNTAEYTKGCWITEECGLGLGPYGYYQCAVAAGIDRVFGYDIGCKSLPGFDELFLEHKRVLCRLCGHFRSGSFVPPEQRNPVSGEPCSASWTAALDRRKKLMIELGRF